MQLFEHLFYLLFIFWKCFAQVWQLDMLYLYYNIERKIADTRLTRPLNERCRSIRTVCNRVSSVCLLSRIRIEHLPILSEFLCDTWIPQQMTGDVSAAEYNNDIEDDNDFAPYTVNWMWHILDQRPKYTICNFFIVSLFYYDFGRSVTGYTH